MYALLLECLDVDGDADALAEVMSAHYAAPASYVVFPDVEDVLKRLAADGLRMGTLSNTDVDLWAILAHLGVTDMLDAAIALRSQVLRSHRPKPSSWGCRRWMPTPIGQVRRRQPA